MLKVRSEKIGQVNKRPNRDWSFSQLTQSETSWGPHGYHRYPAKFIPQLVRRIIDEYSMPGSLVVDPFVGSATTGIEALRSGRHFWGGDINPVAVLISQAKCTPVPPSLLKMYWEIINKSISELRRVGRRQLTEDEKRYILSIHINRATSDDRFQYWFPKAHMEVLERILEIIKDVPDKEIYRFFLCAFSNILRGCSIWLSGSTKPQKDLNKFLADPVEVFLRQSQSMIRRNKLYWEDLLQSNIIPATINSSYTIGAYDARQLPLQDGQANLIVSSPPYATCYQYLDLHQLTQLWFERHQILPSVNVHHGCIGEVHSTPNNGKGEILNELTGSRSADKALRELEQKMIISKKSAIGREVSALRNYFADMYKVMGELHRIIKPGKYLVLIVGDSRKRGVNIPTADALCEMASACGFDLKDRIVRKVPARVLVSTRNQTTGRFSSTAESNSQAYPEEDILIFRSPASKI